MLVVYEHTVLFYSTLRTLNSSHHCLGYRTFAVYFSLPSFVLAEFVNRIRFDPHEGVGYCTITIVLVWRCTFPNE